MAQTRLAEADLDLDSFMQVVIGELEAVVEASGVVIELIDGDDLVYKAASASLSAFIGLRIKRTGSLSGLCVEKAELLVSNDTSTDPRVDRAACERTGLRAMICAPLIREGEVAGVVKICSDRTNRFDEDDVQALRLLTAALAAEMRKQLRFAATEHDLGERIALEASLRASEQRLAGIIGNAHQAIVTMTEDGIITCWNRQAELTFGWSEAEAIGCDLAELIVPPELRAMHRSALRRFVETGEGTLIGRRIEVQALHRSGNRIPVELAINAARLQHGWEFTALLHDISERRKQTEQFENAFNHAPIGMALVALDGGFMRVNEAFGGIVGYSSEEIETLDFQVLTHPADLEADLAQLADLISGKITSYKLDKRYLHKSGRFVRVRLSVSMVQAEDGSAPHFIAQVEDLTSEFEAENRYRLMARNSTDMITTTDLEGRITFISPSCEKIVGLNPADLLGKPALDFVHPEDLAAVRREYRTLIKSGAAEPVRWRSQRRDGGWVWLESSIGILHDAQDEGMTGFIDVVRDVTDRKQREDALAAATLKAEEAVRSKSDFVANVSHELRTPLNSVIGFSRLLDEAPELTDETRRRVRLIHSAGQALRGVIDNVLDFSKLEAAALELNCAPFDLHDFIRQTVALMGPQAAAKDIELRALLGSDVPAWVLADDMRLRQVILNLLSNAVKFTQEGTVTLTVWATGKGEDARLRVEVRDTGAGISAERAETLFNRFVQAGPAIALHYGGTGLGLAISRQLIELMHGTIGVTSKVGEGSTFWFEVPLCEAAHESAPAKPVARGLLGFAGKRILVVDDVDLNRDLMLATLSRYGFHVSMAFDGAAAVDAVRNDRFDLVLMDCQMPVMDGFTATRTIRALTSSKSSVPIVALTASAQTAHLERCRESGMDDQLTKPLDERQLERVLHRLLSPENGSAPAAVQVESEPEPAPKPSLKERYQTRKQAALERIAAAIRTGAFDDEGSAELQSLAHQLAGVSGMFGEAAFGDLASKLDDGLQIWPREERLAQVSAIYCELLAA
ncbi:PAS domain S-box protein [Sphingomonas gei]|uniref:PAS domain S-box protein n=1 Tax=Sphingomonas gei TaxID=1395960 RepID=UPI001442405D|nr:PAS domain S-box protein [Sphingomonas gei]